MRVNPFSDSVGFLTHGGWTTFVFWLLMVASVIVAALNFRRHRNQRHAIHIWNWAARFFIGAMWWQQSLWKMPPTYTDRADGTGGLRYWVGVMADNSAFSLQSEFVKKIVQPHFLLFAPQVYFGEVLVAVLLILGVFSRLGGLLGALMAINLWFGLYRVSSEWPWTYFFLVVIQLMFVAYAPGRSLGIDAMLIERVNRPNGVPGWWRRILRSFV